MAEILDLDSLEKIVNENTVGQSLSAPWILRLIAELRAASGDNERLWLVLDLVYQHLEHSVDHTSLEALSNLANKAREVIAAAIIAKDWRKP
jgi:hypothetical protein